MQALAFDVVRNSHEEQLLSSLELKHMKGVAENEHN
jgi:hypothetical protein